MFVNRFQQPIWVGGMAQNKRALIEYPFVKQVRFTIQLSRVLLLE